MIAYALHMKSEGDTVAAKTVGFAIADEDRQKLDELVDYFGKGNRSEFLRVAIRRLHRDMISDQLRQLQSRARGELGGTTVSRQEVTELVKQTTRGDN